MAYQENVESGASRVPDADGPARRVSGPRRSGAEGHRSASGSGANADHADGGDVRPVRPAPPCVRSEDLLQGGRELWIVHGTEVYRLSVTRNNRLILQK